MNYKTDDTLRGLGFWRVYFNRQGTKEEAFSIDAGQGNARRHFRTVTLSNLDSVRFVATGKKPDGINPIAWAEVSGRLRVEFTGDQQDAVIDGVTAIDRLIQRRMRGERKRGLHFVESELPGKPQRTRESVAASRRHNARGRADREDNQRDLGILRSPSR